MRILTDLDLGQQCPGEFPCCPIKVAQIYFGNRNRVFGISECMPSNCLSRSYHLIFTIAECIFRWMKQPCVNAKPKCLYCNLYIFNFYYISVKLLFLCKTNCHIWQRLQLISQHALRKKRKKKPAFVKTRSPSRIC